MADRLVHSARGWAVLIGLWLIAAMIVTGALLLGGSEGGWLPYLVAWSGLALVWAFGCLAIYRLISELPFTESPLRAALAHALLATLIVFTSLATLFSLLHLTAGVSWSYPLRIAPWALSINYAKYAVIAGILTALHSDRRRRIVQLAAERHARRAALLGAELTSARLENLRSQLNPHFLFNALNSIAALVERERKDAAYGAITRLADLLRMALARYSDEFVTLRQEFDFVRAYLEIERLRFRERLNVDVDLPAAAARLRVPPLILQPLVENAVRHGVEKSPDEVRVRVGAAVCGSRLELWVEDDGPGPKNAGSGRGLGLHNVRQRLATLYGSAAGLEFGASDPHGAWVRIALPLPAPIEAAAELPQLERAS